MIKRLAIVIVLLAVQLTTMYLIGREFQGSYPREVTSLFEILLYGFACEAALLAAGFLLAKLFIRIRKYILYGE